MFSFLILVIHLDHFPSRRPEPKRKVESLSIVCKLNNNDTKK